MIFDLVPEWGQSQTDSHRRGTTGQQGRTADTFTAVPDLWPRAGDAGLHHRADAVTGGAVCVSDYAAFGTALGIHVPPFPDAAADLPVYLHHSRNLFPGDLERHCPAGSRDHGSAPLRHRTQSLLRGHPGCEFKEISEAANINVPANWSFLPQTLA